MGEMARKTTRGSSRLQLQVDSARTIRIPQIDGDQPLLPWPVASIGGGLLSALAGALAVAGIVFVGWLSAIAVPVADMLSFAGRGWLLVNGGRLDLGSGAITLIPLTLTFAVAALVGWVSGFGYRQARLAQSAEPSPQLRLGLIAGTAAQVCLGYSVFSAGVAWGVGELPGGWTAVVGAAVLSFVAALVGAVIADGYLLAGRWPGWLRAGFRGAVAGALGLIGLAAVVLLIAVIHGGDRIQALEDGIGFDTGGLVVWGVLLVAYLPNLLGWALAWVTGGGFSVGSQTLVSLWTTQLGMLPAVPAFGALPAGGAADPWLMAWLGGGVLVGLIAGLVAARAGDGPVWGIVAAGCAGLLTGVLFLAWLALSAGGLGVLRMADLGPRMLDSTMIGLPLLVLSALLGGSIEVILARIGAARAASGH